MKEHKTEDSDFVLGRWLSALLINNDIKNLKASSLKEAIKTSPGKHSNLMIQANVNHLYWFIQLFMQMCTALSAMYAT